SRGPVGQPLPDGAGRAIALVGGHSVSVGDVTAGSGLYTFATTTLLCAYRGVAPRSRDPIRSGASGAVIVRAALPPQEYHRKEGRSKQRKGRRTSHALRDSPIRLLRALA